MRRRKSLLELRREKLAVIYLKLQANAGERAPQINPIPNQTQKP